MMLSLAALGPVYSLNYTWVAIHPDGFLAKVTAPDADIPTCAPLAKKLPGQAGMKSLESGGLWWSDFPGLCWRSIIQRAISDQCKSLVINWKGRVGPWDGYQIEFIRSNTFPVRDDDNQIDISFAVNIGIGCIIFMFIRYR